MSSIPLIYSPELSDEIFDSSTGELIYSPRKSIYVDTYMDAERVQKLEQALLLLDGDIVINTPPPPSPDFLPFAYYRPLSEDMSKYKDFEDYIQKNMKRYNF